MFSTSQLSNIMYTLSCYLLIILNRNYTDTSGVESLFSSKQVLNFKDRESFKHNRSRTHCTICSLDCVLFCIHT